MRFFQFSTCVWGWLFRRDQYRSRQSRAINKRSWGVKLQLPLLHLIKHYIVYSFMFYTFQLINFNCVPITKDYSNCCKLIRLRSKNDSALGKHFFKFLYFEGSYFFHISVNEPNK
ncbi:unnamed protein product [Tenebrio molitor]|nr:unnamed protein product [Tenebrio molitor]